MAGRAIMSPVDSCRNHLGRRDRLSTRSSVDAIAWAAAITWAGRRDHLSTPRQSAASAICRRAIDLPQKSSTASDTISAWLANTWSAPSNTR